MIIYTRCHNCGTLAKKTSNFCSQACFDEWYESKEVPLILINKIIRLMEYKNDQNHPRN